MMMDKSNALAFEDIKVHVRFKLFALWTSVMFFYIYGDYFELYQPGKLQDVIAGRMPFGAISQGVLLGMAAVMIIPSLMPFLSLVLPTGVLSSNEPSNCVVLPLVFAQRIIRA